MAATMDRMLCDAIIRSLWVVSLLSVAIACGGNDPKGPTPPDRPPPLAALPTPSPASSQRFEHSIRCEQCHLASDDAPNALKDAAGRDISPSKLWRTSMMAMAARDPFYLAVWSEERSRFPEAKRAIDKACARCHAPMATIATNNNVSFEDLVSGTHAEARLARDGVSCSLCHQIEAGNLDTESSYSGGFAVSATRLIYGPHANPNTGPMKLFVKYTPTKSDHILDSALCGTCHIVLVEPLDDEGNPRGFKLIEQATYFEWKNSSFSSTDPTIGLACADCHVPSQDEEEQDIQTPIATNPNTLLSRSPFGRHLFVGANTYLNRLFAANIEWAGADLDAAEFLATAAASEEHLRTATELTITAATQSGGTAVVSVRVDNKAGHKFPTGYPTRRAWLHVVARDSAGTVVFESGAVDATGALTAGNPREVRPHLDVVKSSDQVVVWEAVLVTQAGKPTHRALDAFEYGKDTRILPKGFSMNASKIDQMRPIGAESDSNFVPGSDTVTFEFEASAAMTVDVELYYQTLPPHVGEDLDSWPTPAGVRFSEMIAAQPPIPTVIAQTTTQIP